MTTSIGCFHHTRVRNPFPGVYRVAVLPFNDKSSGREGLNTELVTQAFASELQKIPTFEVVPPQEVIEVLGYRRIETNQPELAFAVARALHCQGVLVGDVTDYEPYYPPRLGLHCQLYVMVTGEPELVVDNELPPRPTPTVPGMTYDGVTGRPGWDLLGVFGVKKKKSCRECKPLLTGLWERIGPHKEKLPDQNQPTIRSADKPTETESAITRTRFQAGQTASEAPSEVSIGANQTERSGQPPVSGRRRDEGNNGRTGIVRAERGEIDVEEVRRSANSIKVGTSVRSLENPTPVIEPWTVRHSRVFDGGNLGLAYKLRDYHFFRRDDRGGDWEGYLERSEDFLRFAANRMLEEMLNEAGGRWTPNWGVTFPKPWEPWPWR